MGTAASVGGATVLWVSSLTPRDVPFVAPVHPRLVQRQTPVVASPLPKPRVVVRRKVTHVQHAAPKPAAVATPVVVPRVTPVVRRVTPPPASKPKPKPVVPAPGPAPAPAPPPTPAPAPAPAPVPAAPAPAPVVTTAAPPTETTPPPAPPPPPPTTTPDDNSKPGNGYGDQNHDHTGPPGQEKKDK